MIICEGSYAGTGGKLANGVSRGDRRLRLVILMLNL